MSNRNERQDNGAPTQSLGNANDPHWEDLFWSAFNSASSPMALLDEAQVFLAANSDLCSRIKRTETELLGAQFGDALAGAERTRIWKDWRQLLQVGRLEREMLLRRGDGTEAPAHVALTVAARGCKKFVLAVLLPRATIHAPGLQVLTSRESAVVDLLALGLTSHQLAAALSISVDTARTHVRNAMRKVSAKTRAELVAKTLAGRRLETDRDDRSVACDDLSG